MKYLLIKDKKKRLKFLYNEKFVFCLKTIFKNKFIYFSLQLNVFYKNIFINYKSLLKNNRCIYTNRKKSILTLFKMSRLFFLRSVRFGLINGFKKI